MHVLNELGWDWRENGVVFHLIIDGSPLQWFIPVEHVRMVFGAELAKVGCPLAPHVGGPQTVSGFFGSISRAFRSVSRGVKRGVRNAGRTIKRGARSVARAAKRSYKAIVPKAVRKGIATAARTVQRAAIKAGRIYSNIERKVLKTIAYVPVLGSVANAALSAARIRDRFLLEGKAPRAKDLMALGRAAGSAALNVVAPGAGTLANAAITAGAGLVTGQRLDRALLAAGTKAASRYVPESVTRGALRAARMVASGKRIDRALASGALTTASHYIPGGKYGQQAFAAARDIASGKRVDRVLGRRLARVAKVPGLSSVTPGAPAYAAARKAWVVARQAEQAAKRARAGIHTAQDLAHIVQGRNTMAGITALASRARNGDLMARAFLRAFHSSR